MLVPTDLLVSLKRLGPGEVGLERVVDFVDEQFPFLDKTRGSTATFTVQGVEMAITCNLRVPSRAPRTPVAGTRGSHGLAQERSPP